MNFRKLSKTFLTLAVVTAAAIAVPNALPSGKIQPQQADSGPREKKNNPIKPQIPIVDYEPPPGPF